MVKVQKPKPKSLAKSASPEGGVSKKTKGAKLSNVKGAVVKAAATALSKETKQNAVGKQKISKVEKNPAAVVNKEVKKKQPKATKKPLILAPSVSPSPEKKQPKASKKPLILAPSPSPEKKQPIKRKAISVPASSPVVVKKAPGKKSTPASTPAPVAVKKAPVKKSTPASTPAPVTVKKAPGKKSTPASTPAPVAVKKAPGKKSTPASPTAPVAVEKAPGKKSIPASTPAPVAVKKAPGKKSIPASTPAPVAVKKAPVKKSTPASTPAPVTVKKAPGKKSTPASTPAPVAVKKAPGKKSTPASTPAPVAVKNVSSKKTSSPTKKLGKPSTNNKLKTNQKKKLKEKPALEFSYEMKAFDEQKFHEIVSASNVQKVCEALKTQVAEELKKQKVSSIFSDFRFLLQVSSYKIPSFPKRMVKLGLKHSLVGQSDDVALIVPDLQRGARFDFEPTKQHYEDLLREAGIEQRLTVVPFNQLRNDMGTFEAKRKFVNTYDYLMCDGKLSGQASAFLGKCTQKPRNVLHPVRLSEYKNQLQKEISRGLCRTAYRQLQKGDLTAIPVGNHEHNSKQLAENILFVTKQLQQVYAGGLANIRSIYVKIDIAGTSSLPLYISMCAAPADTPYVVGPREQRMLKLKKQANEVLSKFALTKDAEFVKLTRDQVKRKAEVREKRAALLSEAANGEDTAVPTKKARKGKESANETVKSEDKSDEDELEEEDESENDVDEDDVDEDDVDEENNDVDEDDEDEDDEDD